ncbi:hypothetical protein BGZ76_005428 [Entomortierella beljakovae]|nr:hypothetical protein BGZ76_005428 [Entomortierella beljakovae]
MIFEFTKQWKSIDMSKNLPELVSNIGFAKFHIAAHKQHHPSNELLISCNKTELNIHDVADKWRHVKKIQLVTDKFLESPAGATVAPTGRQCDRMRSLIKGMRANYFAWTDEKGLIRICNIDQGKLVSYIKIPKDRSHVQFTSDGSLMAITQGKDVTVRWTIGGAVISKIDANDSIPIFINKDRDMILPKYKFDDKYGREQQGAIVDVMSPTAVQNIAILNTNHVDQFCSKVGDHQRLYSMDGSKLDLAIISSYTFEPNPYSRNACGKECDNELYVDYRQSTISTETPMSSSSFTSIGRPAFRVELGPTFRVRYLEADPSCDHDLKSVVVATTHTSLRYSDSSDLLEIPAILIGDIPAEHFEFQISFEIMLGKPFMFVFTDIYVMVWRMPLTENDKVKLVLIWRIQEAPYMIGGNEKWYKSRFATCRQFSSHIKFAKTSDKDEDAECSVRIPIHSALDFTKPQQFLDGALILVEMFEKGDENFKEAATQYLGQYINANLDLDNKQQNTLAWICDKVTQDNYQSYSKCLKAVLNPKLSYWVPRHHYENTENTDNPILILLKKAELMPKAMELAQPIIEYCLEKAHKEKSWHFASPLIRPLEKMLSVDELYGELAHTILQRLAYIPAAGHDFIIDHHKIAHPPQFRWKFWEKNKRPLYKCKNPVLQLESSPTPKTHNQSNDNFTRGVFVASFDLLWNSSNHKSHSNIGLKGYRKLSRLEILLRIIAQRCNPFIRPKTKGYNFALVNIENPAIEALVEYKWSTIGFNYWLVRLELKGLFVTIALFSSVFLWLEIVQFFQDMRSYVRSPYNLADIIVFAFPLAGSLIQIHQVNNNVMDGDVSVLSFSILFVFLHILFELRINRKVCKFVTIIIRILRKVTLFFFVFGAGLLTFTIAILHILSGCPTGICNTTCEAAAGNSTTGDSTTDNSTAGEDESKCLPNFYQAVFSTFFYMGGLYDPISEDIKKGDWRFLTLMLIYFFFTIILLLNVLIALINSAYSKGDETWELVWLENRLKYVESVESISYDIPGFRQMSDIFPSSIYYSATAPKVKAYEDKRNADKQDPK